MTISGKASTIHGILDVFGFKGDVGHQVVEPILGDDNVVFESDAKIFFSDVNAWLHCENMARGNRLMPMPHVVNVKANEM